MQRFGLRRRRRPAELVTGTNRVIGGRPELQLALRLGGEVFVGRASAGAM
ncbi:MAG: hypothetical protein M3Q47_07325 [Actinomycetota bacterium]|nr:hypothetical protein [Actinomycetota bacterium]